MTGFLLVTITAAAVAHGVQLGALYDLIAQPLASLQMEAVAAGLDALMFLAVALVIEPRLHAKGLRSALFIVVAGFALTALVNAFPAIIPLQGWPARLLGGAMRTLVPFVAAIGLILSATALHQSERNNAFDGLRLPLVAGFGGAAGATFAVFPDTLRLVFLISICVTLVIVTLTLSYRHAPLTAAFQRGYFVCGVVAPALIATVVMVRPGLPLLEALGTSAVEAAQTKVTRMSVKQSITVGDTAGGLPLRHRHAVFNDVWFVDEQKAYAVSANRLFNSADGGRSWSEVRRLGVRGLAVRFGANGGHGWVGDPYDAIEVTEDAGATWRRLDPSAIAHEQARLREGADSALHLDIETGYGAFVADGRFIHTADYGGSWQVTELVRAGGKRLRLAGSPFAYVPGGRFAVNSSFAGEVVYEQEADSGHWVPRCGNDETAAIFSKLPFCDEAAAAPALAEFARTYEAANDQLYGLVSNEPELFIPALVDDPAPYSAELDKLPRAGRIRWVAGRGELAVAVGDGPWEVLQYAPQLSWVLPLSPVAAVGLEEGSLLYRTDDAGLTWRRLIGDEERHLEEVVVTPDGRDVFALTSGTLLHLDLGGGAHAPSALFSAEEDEYYGSIGHSQAYDRLWLLGESGQWLHVGDRAGNWHSLAMEASGLREPDGTPLAIAAFGCPDAHGACVALLTDGTLHAVVHTADDIRLQETGFAMLPGDREPEDVRQLLVRNEKVVLAFADARTALVGSTTDDDWTTIELGVRSDWQRAEQIGEHLLLYGDGVIAIGQESERVWKTINPSDWDGEIHLCADEAMRHLYLYSASDFAASGDGGESWERMEVDHPYCGWAAGHLWLKLDELRTFGPSR